jgi:hypothetical protein
MVSCLSLDTNKRLTVKYTDPEFDYSHIPLGYMQLKDQAYYLTREPQRIASQGLTPRAVRSFPAYPLNREHLIVRKEFINCVLGKHASYEEAITMLREGSQGVSIGRHMAIYRQSAKIFMADYRGRTVAISQNKGVSFSPVEHKATHLIVKRLRNHGVILG